MGKFQKSSKQTRHVNRQSIGGASSTRSVQLVISNDTQNVLTQPLPSASVKDHDTVIIYFR